MTKNRTCYWHGNDAVILQGNKKDGYTILVGSYSEKEIEKVKKLVREDRPLGEYDDYVVFAEPEEFREQQN